MRSFIALILLVAVSFQAQAYDEDTHFYGTYMMARHAGIRHEVALKIATSAQWMDESYISDPLSLMFAALSGVKKRRLLHFPSNRYVGKFNAIAEQGALDLTYGDLPDPVKYVVGQIAEKVQYNPENFEKMTTITKTQKDHRIATQLLLMGLKNGDLMQASASLHVLEDSFAHAGTPAGEGHRGAWHWPDRPYYNPDKYFEMTGKVFQALSAIRMMLPESALDCSLQNTESGQPNCKTSSTHLQKAYMANRDVQRTVRHNMLKDEKYVRATLRSMLKIASHKKKVGYLNLDDAEIENLVTKTQVSGKEDVFEVLAEVMTGLTKELMSPDFKGEPKINVYSMIADVYQLENPDAAAVKTYIARHGLDDDEGLLFNPDSDAFKKFIGLFSRDLLTTYVPRRINNDDQVVEMELDKDIVLDEETSVLAPRNIEMKLRIEAMQKLVRDTYARNIEFVPNNSKDAIGFAHEVRMDARANTPPLENPDYDMEYVTFTLAEKNRWDFMIFNYLYPTLEDSDLSAMVTVGEMLKKLTDTVMLELKSVTKRHQQGSWMPASMQVLAVMGSHSTEILAIVGRSLPFALGWFHDLATEVKSQDNYIYHSDRELMQHKLNGGIRAFLTNEDTWNEKLAVNSAQKVRLSTAE